MDSDTGITLHKYGPHIYHIDDIEVTFERAKLLVEYLSSIVNLNTKVDEFFLIDNGSKKNTFDLLVEGGSVHGECCDDNFETESKENHEVITYVQIFLRSKANAEQLDEQDKVFYNHSMLQCC